MSVEEVESAVEQVTATEKFKRAVLNKGLTEFLETGENNLTTGIPLPFERLSKEFKGLEKEKQWLLRCLLTLEKVDLQSI